MPFITIGPLGPHDAKCILELQLQPHLLALVLLLKDRPGNENLAQLWFGMWLVVLPDQGDNGVLRPTLTVWLTHLLEFCDISR